MSTNLQFQFDSLTYSIRPLNLSDPTHLRCVLSITNKNGYQYLDRLDLYNAGARRVFIKKSVPRLETDACLLDRHLLEIIRKLEESRNSQSEIYNPQSVEIPPEQKKEALAYLKSPDLLDFIIADYKSCGYVGEEKNFLTGYLVATSRKLSKPLGMIIISRSGAGKSTIQSAITSFMPPEDCLNYTRMTSLALFYKDRYALKHKLISVDEEKGMQGAHYTIRSLLNAEGLTSTATIKDPVTGNMKTMDKIVEGPSSFLIGTTDTELDHETLSRFVVTTIDESLEQTRRILEKQRQGDTLSGFIQTRARESILIRHHNIQRLLKPLSIINVHAPALKFPDDRLIMRRGQAQYHKIIKTICLLHQYQREIKTAKDYLGEFEYIEVTEKDIELANKIAPDILNKGIDEIGPVTRKFLGELENLTKTRADRNGDSNKFTRRDIREFTKWNDYQIRICLRELENMEYVVRVSGYQGKLCTYELIHADENSGDKFNLGISGTPQLSTADMQICQTLRRKTVLCETLRS